MLLLYYPQHQLIKALLIFLTLYVANEEFTTCEHQSPVNECQAFETQLTTMTWTRWQPIVVDEFYIRTGPDHWLYGHELCSSCPLHQVGWYYSIEHENNGKRITKKKKEKVISYQLSKYQLCWSFWSPGTDIGSDTG